MTWSEKKLWERLRELDANFRRQAPIGRFVVDFASLGRRLVIEVDGGVHERLNEVALRDLERQQWLEGEGFRVLRFSNRAVDDDLEGCLANVEAALERARLGAGLRGEGQEPPAPPHGSAVAALRTPPSPAFPSSRRKGG